MLAGLDELGATTAGPLKPDGSQSSEESQAAKNEEVMDVENFPHILDPLVTIEEFGGTEPSIRNDFSVGTKYFSIEEVYNVINSYESVNFCQL